MPRNDVIYGERFGSGHPLLVLLHGQGGNGDVWQRLRPFIERHWRGTTLIPDLRGHGRSLHRPPYAYGTYAADVASLIGPAEEVVMVGHSLGGAVALMLASGWFGVRVARVIAFGIKVNWSEEELARRRQFAAAPVRWFERREEAIERYLKVSGQWGLVEATAPAALNGVIEEDGKFRLAADPRISGADDPPDIRPIGRAVRVPVTIAVGENDAMVPLADARALDSQALIVPGAGHNVHIERPEAIWELIAAATNLGEAAVRTSTRN